MEHVKIADGVDGAKFYHLNWNCSFIFWDDLVGRKNPDKRIYFEGKWISIEDLNRFLKLRSFE